MNLSCLTTLSDLIIASSKLYPSHCIKATKIFFPNASSPLDVAGPSAITLSVLVSKNFDYSFLDFYQKIFPLIIILFMTSLIILFSNYIIMLLNQTFIKILHKIFGLILGALSVEFITIGLKGIL